MKIEKLVIASRNPAKVEYYRDIFANISDEILGLGDLDIEGKPVESGETAEQNAEIKAMFYSDLANLPVFCEDEALFVDFLSELDQPGVHVRRINGIDEVDDEILLSHWEKVVAQVPEGDRTGRWHVAYCLAFPNGRKRTVFKDHEVLFFLPSSKIRLPGWPMSSLEGSVMIGKPDSEKTQEEKELSQVLLKEEILDKLAELFDII